MADTLNTTGSSDTVTNAAGFSNAAVVVPIYAAMLLRAEGLALSGANLEAADMLTTAAETLRRFEHPAARRVAGWAHDLLMMS
jgi:hypothetical protein